ncbi:putative membrane protein, partial [Vibrio harveyi]
MTDFICFAELLTFSPLFTRVNFGFLCMQTILLVTF